MAERRIETPRDYYSHPWVAGAWLRNLGYEGKLSDKTSLLDGEHDLKGIVNEYLVVSNLDIKRQKDTPMKSIKPWMLSGVLRHNPTTEIFRSSWCVDAPGQKDLPIQEREAKTQIISWDVEYYNNMFPGYPFIDQRGVFERIEPSYLVMVKYLNHFGINHMAVMTGRGYHFLTQVPSGTDTMRQLIEIGNKIEKPVAEMQKHAAFFSKRDRPIPPNSELAHKGAGYLMQYLFMKAIDEARRDSGLKVEVSDRGMEGVSFDQTPLVMDVGEDKIGTLSYYLKHIVKDEYRAGNTGLLRRVVRSVNGRELDGVARLVQVRQGKRPSPDRRGCPRREHFLRSRSYGYGAG